MDTFRVGILLFEGYEELDAIGPYEVFGAAADHGADLSVDLLTVEPTDRVTAAHGLRVEPDGTLGAAGDLDLLVVPGGGWSDPETPGARVEAERGALPEALAASHGAGTTVAGVCTGGMLLSTAGLTDGRPAITHRSAIDDLRAAGAEVVEARVVDDGDVVTAGGVTAGIDLALHLVEREFGAALADEVATYMEFERRTDRYSA
ncbi:AraC family transcriptional regulator [Halobacteriales archaeon QS_1_68_17]|nr:MAG: AraC family transcriptional regulator [Halobacteriales archaeon QS_1_68_17]